MSSVAIVEDHGPLRVFLRDALTSMGWDVAGIAGSVRTGEELVAGSDCELAVIDLHLASEGGGHALIARLREAGASCRIVVFTASADPAELRAALEAGVHGIVLKAGGLPELQAGLRAVAAGAEFISPSLPPDVRYRLSRLQPV